MRKTIIYLIICSIFVLTIPISIGSEIDISTNSHEISLTTIDEGISIYEAIEIQGTTSDEKYDTITFWIPQNSEDVNIIISGVDINPNIIENNYICNITDLNITKDKKISISISYVIDRNNGEFNKKILHTTKSLSVNFNDNDIYSIQDLSAEGHFTLQLYEPTETPLAWYVIVFIVLLVILLAVSTLYAFRKQGTIKTKEISSESQELLDTKKTLLMSILKDIEKQHRSKAISDDTYHKLKEYYKNEAVETMKKIEDEKSKIK